MTTFTIATERDDADLRVLLRENAMPSWVTMSMEREPSFMASLSRFGCDRAVVARERGELVGMYQCAAHSANVNGVGGTANYLGALRVNPAFRHRLRILREGFESIPSLGGCKLDDPWYTSITVDNTAARRILEANLKGMPRYRLIGNLVTLAFSRTRGRRHFLWRPVESTEVDAVCKFHNGQAEQFNFSPRLSAAGVATTGASFFVYESKGQILACMALWNQQDYRQVVARGYRQPLAALLPLYNFYARRSRRIELPRTGCQLDHSFLAFMAAPTDPVLAIDLVSDALALCPTAVLTLGLHASHPWLPHLQRRFRPSAYRTRIYSVALGSAQYLDGRPVQPEASIL